MINGMLKDVINVKTLDIMPNSVLRAVQFTVDIVLQMIIKLLTVLIKAIQIKCVVSTARMLGMNMQIPIQLIRNLVLCT